MPRSSKKGPYIAPDVLKKYQRIVSGETKQQVIKTWSRACTIIQEFTDITFMVHNGRTFVPVLIRPEMVGHKLGEFAPTRTFFGHTPADKKAKPATAEKK